MLHVGLEQCRTHEMGNPSPETSCYFWKLLHQKLRKNMGGILQLEDFASFPHPMQPLNFNGTRLQYSGPISVLLVCLSWFALLHSHNKKKTVLKHVNLKMHSYISETAGFILAVYLQMCLSVCVLKSPGRWALPASVLFCAAFGIPGSISQL